MAARSEKCSARSGSCAPRDVWVVYRWWGLRVGVTVSTPVITLLSVTRFRFSWLLGSFFFFFNFVLLDIFIYISNVTPFSSFPSISSHPIPLPLL